MANTYETVGSVGSLIGAAMESAGHMAQSQMLDLIAKPFGTDITALLYLIGIFGALFTLASGGSYRFTKWLLVGPAIFYFLVDNRRPSDGAEWRFGDRIHDMGKVFKADNGILQAGAGGGNAGQVSHFFLVWDRLVSDIIQELIKLLELTQDKSDLDFIARTDRYMSALGQPSRDPYLTAVLHLALNNKCAKFYALKRVAQDPDVSPDRQQYANEQLRAMGEDVARFNLKEHHELQKWVSAVLKEKANAYQGELSCQQVWELGVDLTKVVAAEQYIEELVNFNRPSELFPDEVRQRLLVKFGMRVENGKVIKDDSVGEEERMQLLINELTARIIVRELSSLKQHMAALQMDDHPQMAYGEAGQKFDQETGRAIRSISYADEFQYKGELIAAGLAMPHLQGMALYFLAMTFPFFAMVTVLPGRHKAVLTWMGLWLWVKLWDFGFAVVMMIDKMLYALLPHGPPMENNDLLDPGKAMNIVFQVDPVYSAHTYYNLLACCMFAIPVVTGFLVSKGGNEVVAALSEGFREFPTMFGNSLSSYQRAMMAQRNVGEINRQAYEATKAAAWDAVLNDKDVKAAFMTAAAEQFGKQKAGELLDMVKKSPGMDTLMGKGVPDAMKRIEGRAFDILAQQNKLVAMAKLRANLSMAHYRASNSDYAVSRASQAVGAFMWNSHDASAPVPGGDLIMVEQARHYLPFGQVYDQATAEGIKFFAGREAAK